MSSQEPSMCATSQVHASADNLKLITFDADGTLYADGCHMEQDNAMIAHIINLMRSNVQVCRRAWVHNVRIFISSWMGSDCCVCGGS